MNIKIVLQTLGRLLVAMAGLLIIPIIFVFAYQEITVFNILGFLIPAVVCLAVGLFLCFIKNEDTSLYAKEGIVIVGLGWILISLIGAIPFSICSIGVNELSDLSFVDYIFESVSGFTTTGASILHQGITMHQIDFLYANGFKGLLLWRSLTHWIGGMGVLIFLVAILPSSQNANSIHLMQAESTGASVDKFTAKMGSNARILYIIYTALTLIQIGLLLLGILFDPEMNAFHAIVLSIGTAGTGGFAATSASVANFSTYTKIIITIFMFLFGINFNMYFLLLIKKIKEFFGNEELRFYTICLIISILIMAAFLTTLMSNIYNTFSNALLDSSFTAVSLMTSTGYAVCDFSTWPILPKVILLFLMFVGACAGSTGGGFKCSRFLLLVKNSGVQLRKILNRRSVLAVKLNGKKVNDDLVSGTNSYFIIYVLIFLVSLFLVSLDLTIQQTGDTLTSFSTVLTCFNNIGPGLTGITGPNGSFFFYSIPTKILLSFLMLLGRLEIYPILLLFTKKTYQRGA